MKCGYCGKENKEDSKFCEECGAKLEELEKEENNNVEDNNFYSYHVDYKYDKEPSNVGLKIVIVILILLIFATIVFGFWYFVLRDTGKGSEKKENTENVEPVKTPEPTSTPKPTSTPEPVKTPEPDITPYPDVNPNKVVCEYSESGATSRIIGNLNNNKITSIDIEMVLLSNEIAKTFYDQLIESNPEYNYVLDGNKVYLENVHNLDREFQLIIGLTKQEFIDFMNSEQVGMSVTCR